MKMDYDEDIERAVTANKVLVTAIRGDMSVSYTHLDVYKRQALSISSS